MHYYDDPCACCPYHETTYGHCDYDEYCQYEEEQMEQQYYLDTCGEDCDLPPVIKPKTWSPEDLADLPF